MKIAIYGYGNLGRGVELSVAQNKDAELFGIFTRRDPKKVRSCGGVDIYPAEEVLKYKDKIDVLIICGGSAADLPEMTPRLARDFNVIDSFDDHQRISRHFADVNRSSLESMHTALISAGWDPGMFSLARFYSSVILPVGNEYTFWGRGVSQGHSDAVRQIDGVIDARQYTVPVKEVFDKVKAGNNSDLPKEKMHIRECYVVADALADKEKITSQIKNMPDYFLGYDTKVEFINEDELVRDHHAMPHGGSVIRTGHTGLNEENKHTVEYSLRLDSNPEFTGNVLISFARAVYKMHLRKEYGCKTVLDVTPADLSALDRQQIIKNFL